MKPAVEDKKFDSFMSTLLDATLIIVATTRRFTTTTSSYCYIYIDASTEEVNKKVLERFNMQGLKHVGIFLGSHFKLSRKESPSGKKKRAQMQTVPYALAIGNIMYAIIYTRSNIAHVVGVVSRFMSDLGKQHLETINWIFRYLRSITDNTLYFDWKSVELMGYVDVVLTLNDLDGMRSTI